MTIEDMANKFELGPRGLLSNYPPNVIAVVNGHPITKNDILHGKRSRQRRILTSKLRQREPLIKPCFVKIMAMWPCGLLPMVENFEPWAVAFADGYHYPTRKRPQNQGMVQAWARIDSYGGLLDVAKNKINFAEGTNQATFEFEGEK